MPQETIPRIDICRTTLIRFVGVIKTGFRIAVIMQITISVIKTARF